MKGLIVPETSLGSFLKSGFLNVGSRCTEFEALFLYNTIYYVYVYAFDSL